MSPRELSLGECAPFYTRYIDQVPDHVSIHHALLLAESEVVTLVEKLPEEVGNHRYAEGKWSIKEVLLHMTDTERIFANRALRIARGDRTSLPGFEQDDYVPHSFANERSLADIMEERNAVRLSTLLLFKSFQHSVLANLGQADHKAISVRAIGYIISGHDLHHLAVVKERYL